MPCIVYFASSSDGRPASITVEEDFVMVTAKLQSAGKEWVPFTAEGNPVLVNARNILWVVEAKQHRAAGFAQETRTFKFLLRLEDGEPNDPAVFVTAVPNWTAGEIIPLVVGERLRVMAIDTEIDHELAEHGINAVFTVEQA